MRNVTRFIDNSYFAKKIGCKTTIGFRPTKPGFRFFKKGWTFRLGSFLDHSLRSISISLIGGYQRYLSPRKGYSCAHRVVHGGQSCSEYVKNVLTDKSMFESTFLARQRFRDCNIASIFSKNRFIESKNSVKVPVNSPDDPILGCIFLIIGAIFSFICGKGNSPCK
jgi:putative component of membrane protein insertase Oxa1/YidC/SpoIIIJ protein YidD